MNRFWSPRLGDVAEAIDYGLTASATNEPTGPKFLRITDIQDGQVDWASVPFCSATDKKVAAAALADGDIVFARTGATTGKSFLVRNPPDRAVFASYLIRVRPASAVDASYLAHYFQSEGYWAQIRAKSQGAAQEGVNAKKLADLSIPLPALDEQRRIAAILDKADALRQKRKRAIALLDSLTQSIFLEMFGDPVQNPNGFATVPLEQIISPRRPITYGILMPGADLPDGVPYVRVVDIQRGKVLVDQLRRTSAEIDNDYKRSRLKRGDLLISIRGHVGRMAIVPHDAEGANITQDTARLAIDGANTQFVMAALTADAAQHWMFQRTKGAAVRGINLGDLRKFPMPLPPRAEQEKFAEMARAMEKLFSDKHAVLALAEQAFASLQHRAFSGQL